MATQRIWLGGTDDWYDAANWLTVGGGPPGYPLPGDVVGLGNGTANLIGSEAKNSGTFDDQVVTLGAYLTQTATLALVDSVVGRYFAVNAGGNAQIEAVGLSDFAGSLNASVAGATLTLASVADAMGTPGNLVIALGGALTVSNGNAVDLEGVVTLEKSLTIGAADPFTNNATVNLLAGLLDVQSTAVSGTGTVRIGVATTAQFESAVPSSQTVAFTGGDGRLKITTPSTFAATIKAFAPEAVIDLTATVGNGASYDAASRMLSVTQNGQVVATLAHVDAAPGALQAASDGSGGTTITYAGTASRLHYEITAAARAEHADIVQAMFVPGTTTPITGAGIRIGILSDSFDVVAPGTANADAKAGYLPATPVNTSAVTVLKEGPFGSVDEGRAMAELVHAIAPGAAIDFYTAANGPVDFAAGVTALQQAGCQIIVDDFAFPGQEPFYQIAGPIDTAITNAIAAGVNYFTLATNYGQAYYEHAYNGTAATLYDGSAVQAMTFSNGTHYQSITLEPGTATRIDLQWDAPFYGVGTTGAAQPDPVRFKLFDANNTLVSTSYQRVVNGQLVAESELVVPSQLTGQSYQLAIYEPNGTAPVGQIKYILFGNPNGAQTPGGTINDPDAGKGSGLISGHALVPGAITVGATSVANTPANGQPLDFNDYFSASGPGELLFDTSGNRIARPIIGGKVDLTAVDGVYTSVAGFQPFNGTSAATPDAAAVAALLLQVNPSLTPAQVKQLLLQSALPLESSPLVQGAGLIQADRALALEEAVACYCEGTFILTDRGERPVELLAIGDGVVTAWGAVEPVRWIGRRSYAGRFLAGKRHLLPVVIRAAALGGGLPRRDLRVSPAHAMLLDGVLVPAVQLLNGLTILQESACSRVDYVHVELARHSAIVAEGAASETFLDADSRGLFSNADDYAARYPNAPPPGGFCAARVEDGPRLEAIRRRIALASRAAA